MDSGEPDGRPNSRNGYGRKTVLTNTGKIALDVRASARNAPALTSSRIGNAPGIRSTPMWTGNRITDRGTWESPSASQCFRSSVSLMAQCLDGVKMGSAAGRDIAEDDSNHGGEAERHQDDEGIDEERDV